MLSLSSINSHYGSFASKVLIFTVGRNKALFNIHEALLQLKTAFFEIHPEPNSETSAAQNKRPEPELEPTFKRESSPSIDIDMSESPATIPTPTSSTAPESTISPTAQASHPETIVADYHLPTNFTRAFSIFVDWLYNTPPTPPRTPSQAKILIQAYLLALTYQARGLQNLLLDCLRRYHSEHQVNFDLFFIYLLNRHGDDVDCKLVKYFVDQIAYEIADSGVDEFDATNGGFDYFLRERPQGRVRSALVHAVAKLAFAGKGGAKIVDPASAQVHDYYV